MWPHLRSLNTEPAVLRVRSLFSLQVLIEIGVDTVMLCSQSGLYEGLTHARSRLKHSRLFRRFRFVRYCWLEGSSWRSDGGIFDHSIFCQMSSRWKVPKTNFCEIFCVLFFERKMSEKATENGVKESDVSEPFILPSNRQPTNEVLEGINWLDLYLGIDTEIVGLLVPLSEE